MNIQFARSQPIAVARRSRRSWHINGRFLTQPLTGVQRYAREIVRALDELIDASHTLADGLDIDLLTPLGTPDQLGLKKIRVRTVGKNHGHLWEQNDLARAARGHLISLCNTGPVSIRSQIICIHDANTRVVPQSYSPAFRALYGVLLPLEGRSARKITTVSQDSADQLARFGIAARSKTIVVPNGHEHALRWKPERSETVVRIAGPRTIVMMGSHAPHKNIGLILGLAPKLAAAGLTLAVTGRDSSRVFANAIRSPVENVHWLGALSDNELAALFADCLCLAFPSISEGFGLPALEAMTLGCPVVASDRASLPEVCGDAALYASPSDADAWLARFLRLRDSPHLRRQMSQKGIEQARKFSWQASAELYLRAMAEMDSVAQAISHVSPAADLP